VMQSVSGKNLWGGEYCTQKTRHVQEKYEN
jgi:DNA gyrase inhibitor GyrI